LLSQVGDTSLPEEAPDPSTPPSEEVLKALHHVLMEVRNSPPLPLPTKHLSSDLPFVSLTLLLPFPLDLSPARVDPHRGGSDGLPKLLAFLPDIEWNP
jgi:hypothetical protein